MSQTGFYFSKDNVKARKEHECFLCGARIKKGETHSTVKSKPYSADPPTTFHYCNTCGTKVQPHIARAYEKNSLYEAIRECCPIKRCPYCGVGINRLVGTYDRTKGFAVYSCDNCKKELARKQIEEIAKQYYQ